MAQSRKDARGRVLHKGEIQGSSDGRYLYTYTDPLGERRYIYANDLPSLWEKEEKLTKDQLDGLDRYATGGAPVNDMFDWYISTKYNLRDNTRSGYVYMYDYLVREDFGKHRLIDIKYSDVLQCYLYPLDERNLVLTTLDSTHCILHLTFQFVVRDDIIRENPTDGVTVEVKKKAGMYRSIRHALTAEQQRAFMDYTANHPVYVHWWPIPTILLGTGCRIGEAPGLRWQGLDFEKGVITIDHALIYYKSQELGDRRLCVSKPKTEAGIRTIPVPDVVRGAPQIPQDEEIGNGPSLQEIDGYSGFTFQNYFGEVPNPGTVNRATKRISDSYNVEEILDAKKEGRNPILFPNLSCHHLRHTFATRPCKAKSNLKMIQSVMGHKNIETTMDIYAEATDRKKEESFNVLADKFDNVF